jgi:hypothetical protein
MGSVRAKSADHALTATGVGVSFLGRHRLPKDGKAVRSYGPADAAVTAESRSCASDLMRAVGLNRRRTQPVDGHRDVDTEERPSRDEVHWSMEDNDPPLLYRELVQITH